MANGHSEALKYPIGMLRDEAAIVTEIENRQLTSSAIVTRNAVAAVMVEEGGEIFRDMIERLENGK